MTTCLIHSQAMRYSDPTHLSPEEEIIAQAAYELFRSKRVGSFAIFVNVVINGVKESDVLMARLEQLGIPRAAFVVQPVADTTDAEFETFAQYVHEHSVVDAAVLSIEAKKGRLERIAARTDFFPTIYWAEEILATSSDKKLQKLVAAWRKSGRHGMLRLRLGLLPMALMKIDPQSKIQRRFARLMRH